MSTCPSCGRENPDGFAFCPGCGTRLAAAALPEERKVVTALFCDLVSFTAHSETSDHELIDGLLQQYNAVATRLVEEHGGAVEKFIGDAVLAVFGFPRAHEDDAERAVRCGLRLVTEVGRLTWPDGDPVQVRIGVNSGETYLHTGVDPASGQTFLTGDAVNTAARLETAAPPNGVVVGELTQSLTAQTIAYEKLDPLKVKGKKVPVRAWLARRAAESRSRTGLRTTGKLDTPFLGRNAELRALEASFDAASSTGQAQFRLLVGEPGIGKSRLVLEFARLLDQCPEPITWRQGRCLPFGEGVAFWALGEIVKAHGGILDSDDVATVEAKLEAVLPEGERRPWFRQRLRPLLGLEGAQVSREEAFAAWTQFLTHLAAKPTVLVLEDLHWAGEGMLAFVEHLAAQDLEAPLLVLATTRPELLTKHPEALAPGGPVEHLMLSPLGRRDASRLVSALLDERLAAAVRAPIIKRAGGNPLYAEEYVRLLLDRGLLLKTKGVLQLREGAELPLPDTVQAVLAARLDTLPAEHKALLCDGAVFGESFWDGGVAALAGRDADTVVPALALLAERQLVRPTVSSTLEGQSEYLFWHALARDVAYGQLPRKARARKHEEAALWIEAQAGERASDHAEVLAHHYVTALDLARALRDAALAEHLTLPAGRHLSAAGEKTLRLDIAAALSYYEKALGLLTAGTDERAHAVYYMAEALFWRGRRQEAIAAYEDAAASYLAVGDRNMAALCTIELAEMLYNECDPSFPGVFERGLALLDEERPSRALVLALSEAAGMNLGLHGAAAALDAADRALEMAQRLALPASPYALEWRACALAETGDIAGALRDYQRAVEEGAAQGIGGELCRIYHNWAGNLSLWEGPEAALQPLRENVERARQTGMEFWELGGLCAVVSLLTELGRWDEAMEKAREAEARITASGYAQQLLDLRLTVALIATLQGDEATAGAALEWLEEPGRTHGLMPDTLVGVLAMRALCKARLGDRAAARALLVDCADHGERLGTKGRGAWWLPFFVEASLLCGDVEVAARLGFAADARVPRDAIATELVKAMLAEAKDEPGTAAGSYAAAAARANELGVPYEEAQSLLGQGRCLMALGRAPEAAPVLEAAREIFARLGARPAQQEADQLLSASCFQ